MTLPVWAPIAHALKHSNQWEWLPGMEDLDGWRVLEVDEEHEEVTMWHAEYGVYETGFVSSLPNLDDAGTRGCLQELMHKHRDLCLLHDLDIVVCQLNEGVDYARVLLKLWSPVVH